MNGGFLWLCLSAFPHCVYLLMYVSILMYGNSGLLSRQQGETLPCLAGTLHVSFCSGGSLDLAASV